MSELEIDLDSTFGAPVAHTPPSHPESTSINPDEQHHIIMDLPPSSSSSSPSPSALTSKTQTETSSTSSSPSISLPVSSSSSSSTPSSSSGSDSFLLGADRTGWLQLQDESGSEFYRHFFVLKDCQLFYYDTETPTQQTRGHTISLEGSSVEIVPEQVTHKEYKHT